MESVIFRFLYNCYGLLEKSWRTSLLGRVYFAVCRSLRKWCYGSALLVPLFADWRENTALAESLPGRVCRPAANRFRDAVLALSKKVQRAEEGSVSLRFLHHTFNGAMGLPFPFAGKVLIGFGLGNGAAALFLDGSLSNFRLLLIIGSLTVGGLFQLFAVSLQSVLGNSALGRLFFNTFEFTLDLPAGERGKTSPAVPVCLGIIAGAGLIFYGLFFIKALAGLIFLYLLFRWPWLGLAATAAALPILPTSLVLGLVFATLLAWMVQGIRRGSMDFRPDPIFVPACFLMLAAFLSTVSSLTPLQSVQYLIMYLGYFFLYLLASQLLREKGRLRATLAVLLLVGILVSVLGILQYGSGVQTAASWVDVTQSPDISTRVYSTFGNPNVLAEYLALLIPLGVGFLWSNPRWYGKVIHLGIIGVLFIGLILTFSRGAWLSVALAAFLFALLKERRLLPVFAVGALAAPVMLPGVVLHRISTIGSLQDSSNYFRISIWLGSLRMLKDFWLSGAGLGFPAFTAAYIFYRALGAIAMHSHNLYLEIILEMGLVGALAFLWLMFSFIKYNLREFWYHGTAGGRVFAVTALCGACGELFHGLFDNVWYSPKIALLFWFVMGISFAALRAFPREESHA